jgi:HPr kinase/phosphorylase
MIRVHGTCVALSGKGVLLRGPPASGKSDLALRLVDGGALLVADDQTELYLEADRIIARAPAVIAGRLEVRGVGIVSARSLDKAPLELVIDLVSPDRIERMPDPRFWSCFGRPVPLLRLAPFESSAPTKVRIVMDLLVRTGSPLPESAA